MSDYQLGVIERQFAEMVWDSVPVTASALAKQCESVFGWKKTTAYTVLKRLCNKGLFALSGGVVTAILSRQDFEEGQSRAFVDDNFGGDFPTFLAAFTAKKKLTAKEVESLRRMIADYPEGASK